MNIGDRVGPYTVERKLGEGGMGVAWKARDAAGGIVVVKSIRIYTADPEASAQLQRRLRREAEILGRLRHDHIVRYVETIEDDGEVRLVIDFVDGCCLEEAFSGDEALDLPDRLLILRQVAEALEYAHGLGVIHRDLKPGNVMVTSGPRAQVLDFGLARALDSSRLTATGVVMGTVAFMAPEQARGDAVDGRADLFALGMILARALDLQRPFPGGATSRVYSRLVSFEPVEFDAWLPEDIAEGLRALVAKDPKERTATAKEALDFLDSLIREGPALADRVEKARQAPVEARAAAPRLPSLPRHSVSGAVETLTDRSGAGQGGTLLILGHPGGGKTDALKLARERLEAAGLGTETQGFVPDGLVHLIALQHLGQRGAFETRSFPRADAPGRVDASEATVTLMPEAGADLERLIDPFIGSIRESAECGPIALLLDDVQHAAAEELSWIERLIQLTREVPLLLLLGADLAPEGAGPERTDAYCDFLARLALTTDVIHLPLELFTEDELRAALVEASVPPDVAATVSRHSGGNVGVVHHLLREWHRGEKPDVLARTAPYRMVSQLSCRWRLIDEPSRKIVRALVDSTGELPLDQLLSRSGLTRLVLRSKLRELERKHGWLKTTDSGVMLTQPFLAALLAKEPKD